MAVISLAISILSIIISLFTPFFSGRWQKQAGVPYAPVGKAWAWVFDKLYTLGWRSAA